MHSELKEYWFIFQNDQLLLMKINNEYKLPDNKLLSELKLSFIRQHKLGKFNNILCYCAEIDSGIVLPPNIYMIALRKAFELLGVDWYAASVKASSIINWDKNHQFCGRCGHATVHKPGTFERVCESCGLFQYPRISPSMIVLIRKDDELLMARSPHFPAGAYGLIAGFVEAGESIEEAVHREVKEEVGIAIKNLHYFGSQSWPFPDSLMFGFIADYAGGELVIDHNELEAAGWYRYDNLPGRPSTSLSIAGRLIDHFIAVQKQK
jgi:NAD+ diphosphatase